MAADLEKSEERTIPEISLLKSQRLLFARGEFGLAAYSS